MFDCEPMAGDMERAEDPGGPPPEEGGGPPPGAEGEGAGRSGDCCGAGGVPEAPRTAPAGLRAPPLPPESSSAPLSSGSVLRMSPSPKGRLRSGDDGGAPNAENGKTRRNSRQDIKRKRHRPTHTHTHTKALHKKKIRH